MSNIHENLQKILHAVWGKDVRQAIHDAIHDCYEDGSAGSTDLIAREDIEELEATKATRIELAEETADRLAEVAVERGRIDNLVTLGTGVTNATKRTETTLFSASVPCFGNVSGNSGYFNLQDSIDDFDYIKIRYSAFGKTGIVECKPADFPTTGTIGSSVFHWSEIQPNTETTLDNPRTVFRHMDFYAYNISSGNTHRLSIDAVVFGWNGDATSNGKISDSFAISWDSSKSLYVAPGFTGGVYSIIGVKYTDAGVDKDTELTDIRTGVDGTVYQTAGGAVRGQIEDITNRLDGIESNFGDEYDSTETYAVGDRCVHEGVWYECNTAISTAEDWTEAHWDKVSLGDITDQVAQNTAGIAENASDIQELKEELTANDILSFGKTNLESGGYNSTDGLTTTRKRLRLIAPVYVKKGTCIKLILDGWYYRLWELSTNSLTGGNALYDTSAWITTDTYKVLNDCYVYIVFANAATESASTVIETDDFDNRLVLLSPIKSISEKLEILSGTLVQQYDPVIQQGAFVSSGDTIGTEVNSTKSVRTDWIPSDELISVYCDATTYIYRAYLYGADRVYINRTTWQNTQGTKTASDLIGSNTNVAYIRIQVSGKNNETLTVADFDQYGVDISCKRYMIDSLQDQIDVLNNDIDALNDEVFADTLPTYWQAYMSTKLPTVQEKIENAALNGDSFVFITDYHYDPVRESVSNAGYSHLLIKQIAEQSSLRMLVFGGDAINGNAEKSTALEQMRTVSNRMHSTGCDVFGLRGNHEYNLNDGGSLEQMIYDTEIYSLFNKKSERYIILSRLGLDYYIDNVNQKIRYICMDSKYERTGEDAPIISDDQITWMQTRMTELDSTWSLVVLTHELFASNPNTGSEVTSIGYNASGQKIHDGVLGVINTLNATLTAVICGHVHYDFSTNEYGFWEISVTTDSKQEKGQWGRYTGDYREHAFDVFSIDKSNSKLYATRIGRGADREWLY